MMAAEFIYYLLSLAFLAGLYVAAVKQVRKDVSNVGGKMAREIAKSNLRHHNTSLALMLTCQDEQRDKIAELLKVEET